MINDCASNSPIDHAVELIGYTHTHWIIKNSWGNGGVIMGLPMSAEPRIVG